MPKRIKTDNGPTYIVKAFTQFCITMGINNSTGIPYKPQGQAIVEMAHHTLKHQIEQLRTSGYIII